MDIRIYYIIFLVSIAFGSLLAQPSENFKVPGPKRFIDHIEVFAGLNLNIPNDHGWAEQTYSGSDKRATYKAKPESGHFIGTSLTKSITKRFELQGRFQIEKRKYSEKYQFFDFTGDMTSESLADQRNNYLVFSLVPTYYTSSAKKLHLYTGLLYARLTKSLNIALGSAPINTITGFDRNIIDALAGIGYCFSLNPRSLDGVLRIQGNYGLTYTSHQNNHRISVNGFSVSFSIRYSK